MTPKDCCANGVTYEETSFGPRFLVSALNRWVKARTVDTTEGEGGDERRGEGRRRGEGGGRREGRKPLGVREAGRDLGMGEGEGIWSVRKKGVLSLGKC